MTYRVGEEAKDQTKGEAKYTRRDMGDGIGGPEQLVCIPSWEFGKGRAVWIHLWGGGKGDFGLHCICWGRGGKYGARDERIIKVWDG